MALSRGRVKLFEYILYFFAKAHRCSFNLKNLQETFDGAEEIELGIELTVEFSSLPAYYVFEFQH